MTFYRISTIHQAFLSLSLSVTMNNLLYNAVEPHLDETHLS